MPREHIFNSYILDDPIPGKLWRTGEPIEGLKVGFCNSCGFYHTDPYPSEKYLMDFYQKYEMPTSQANLVETARLLAANLSKDSRVVDLGCGDGKFLEKLHKLGFSNLYGFDQGPALERAQQLDFGHFEKKSVWSYLSDMEATGGSNADAMVMINVLEHVTEPLILLERIYKLLPEHGVLCITVPNDFSPLQQAFLKVKGHLPWFVCLPDHLNYFSFKTLNEALKKVGFNVLDQSALYPLELFLLQDLDYIASPDLGPIAHQRRVTFEENLKAVGMTDTLDHFYRTLASGGYGRQIMVVAGKHTYKKHYSSETID